MWTWIRRFILFHGKRHPNEMGSAEVEAFLAHLAVKRHVAASTQNQAFSALLFLYRGVLGKELAFVDATRPRKPARLPVVLTRQEVQALLAHLDGVHHLMAGLLYGAGLRLMECVRLRVKDVDFYYGQLIVRDGKGHKDRVTMLPRSGQELLGHQDVATTMIYTHVLNKGGQGVDSPLDRL